MKWLGLVLLAGIAMGEEMPLPQWRDGEREALEKDGWVAGGQLLNYDPVEPRKNDPEAVQPKPDQLEVEAPKVGEIEEEEASDWVPEEYLQTYFGERPERFLVDPQHLLEEKDAKDRLGFLNYHAGDSSIDLFVYVFGASQDVPGAVRAEETVERFFSTGRPAAVVFYYLGAPQRSVMYLSPSLTDGIPAAEQRRAVKSSVMTAFAKVSPAEQLEAFTVQMSIRLYWMERMLAGEAVPDEEPALADVEEPVVVTKTESPLTGWWRGTGSSLALPVGSIAGILSSAVGCWVWMKSKARYRFPEFEVEPRLGGSHAAGVGAVISFASANLPPALQRDQVPDYLRRA